MSSGLKLEQEKEVQVQSGLFRKPAFLFLWIASLLSGLSVSMYLFQQSWYVVQILGAEASIGLIYIAMSVPRLLFMMVGGVLADRMRKSTIMFISDISRAVIILGVVYLVFTGAASIWSMVIIALLYGILDAFFWPASQSLIPGIVDKEQLTRANSVIQFTNNLTMIGGPMVAGFLVEWFGFTVSFAITGASLFIASIFIFLIRSPKADQATGETSFLQSLVEGLRYVKKSTVLTTIFILSALLNVFLAGPLNMALPLYVKNVLNGSTLDFSFLEGALAGGMLLGAVVIGTLNVQKKRGFLALIALTCASLMFLALSMSTWLWLSLIVIFVMGFMFTTTNIPIISLVQGMVDLKMIGRVMSLLTTCSMGFIPVSYAMTSGLLAFGLTVDTIMMGGASLLLLFVIIVFWKVRVMRDVD
jgi:MFS family permease